MGRRLYRTTPHAAPAQAHGTAPERYGEPSTSRRYAVCPASRTKSMNRQDAKSAK